MKIEGEWKSLWVIYLYRPINWETINWCSVFAMTIFSPTLTVCQILDIISRESDILMKDDIIKEIAKWLTTKGESYKKKLEQKMLKWSCKQGIKEWRQKFWGSLSRLSQCANLSTINPGYIITNLVPWILAQWKWPTNVFVW